MAQNSGNRGLPLTPNQVSGLLSSLWGFRAGSEGPSATTTILGCLSKDIENGLRLEPSPRTFFQRLLRSLS